MSGVFSPELSCRIVLVTYDPCSRIGKVQVDERDSCDGRPAIELFLKIAPDIQQVCVFAGDERGRRDRTYVRNGGDQWAIYDGFSLSRGTVRVGADMSTVVTAG